MRNLIAYLEKASEEGRLVHSMEEITDFLSEGSLNLSVVIDIGRLFNEDNEDLDEQGLAALNEWQDALKS